MVEMDLEQEVAPRRDPTLTILFSLFLTVLAFFILLNAIATHRNGSAQHDRAQAVTESVTTTFAQTSPRGTPADPAKPAAPADQHPPMPGAATGPDTAPAPAKASGEDEDDDAPTPIGAGSGTSDSGTGDALRAARLAGSGPLDGRALTRAVGRLFDPGLPVTRTATSDRGRLMQITLPATDLFDAEGPDLKRSATPLIDRIAVLIARRPTGVRYAVTFTAAVATDAGEAEQLLAMRRGLAIAEMWSQRGGPPDGLSIGVRPGRKGEVRLTFDALPSLPQGARR